jgi:Zn-dependent protease with chaperone function
VELSRFEASADGWGRLAAQAPGAHRMLVRCALLATTCSVIAVSAWLVMAAGAIAGWLNLSPTYTLVAQAAVVVYLLWSLAARIDWPSGVRIGRTHAPELFDLIDRCREELDAGPVDVVQISGEFGVRAVRIPALGPYGPTRTYLVLGLPVLMALTPAQLEILIAHELAHLAGRRSVGLRAYRTQATWLAFAGTLSRRRPRSAWPFIAFLDWYLPRLRAMALPVLRELERNADLMAAARAGSAEAANALITAQLTARYVDEQITPASYEKLREALPAPRQVLREGLALELLVAGDPYDPRPSIAERLAGADIPANGIVREPPAPGETAASVLLRRVLDEIGELLDGELREREAPSGEADDEQTAELQQRRRDLESLQGWLPIPQMLELADLTARLDGPERAIVLLRDLVTEQPDDPVARYALGTSLLDCGDAEGLEHLQAIAHLPDETGELARVRLLEERRNPTPRDSQFGRAGG